MSMDENDPNGEARRLLAGLEHEIEAMWRVLGPDQVRPPVPTVEPEPEATVAAQQEPVAQEMPVVEPPSAPKRPTFGQRLAKIAAS
jgi:hypothetical protein